MALRYFSLWSGAGRVAGQQLLERHWALILVGSPSSVQACLKASRSSVAASCRCGEGYVIGAQVEADGPAVSEAVAAITDAEGDLEGVGLEALETETVGA